MGAHAGLSAGPGPGHHRHKHGWRVPPAACRYQGLRAGGGAAAGARRGVRPAGAGERGGLQAVAQAHKHVRDGGRAPAAARLNFLGIIAVAHCGRGAHARQVYCAHRGVPVRACRRSARAAGGGGRLVCAEQVWKHTAIQRGVQWAHRHCGCPAGPRGHRRERHQRRRGHTAVHRCIPQARGHCGFAASTRCRPGPCIEVRALPHAHREAAGAATRGGGGMHRACRAGRAEALRQGAQGRACGGQANQRLQAPGEGAEAVARKATEAAAREQPQAVQRECERQ
mmetsp:Transcript_50723/g.127370  ORF Transcript_50723/g.127370 Transcript_50723/m.127370 type:complete len:283 (-) Transcript_50723:28-876(-)